MLYNIGKGRKAREEEKSMKLGVITDCLKQPVREAVMTAKSLGITGVQIYATKGTFSPDALDAAARADFCAFLKENGMEVSALCGDMGGYGFERITLPAWKRPKPSSIWRLTSARILSPPTSA